MKIDEENEFVCYNDEAHKYWTKVGNKNAISVTTLVGTYGQPFDKDFWTGYKSLQSLVSKESFNSIKDKLTRSKVFDDSLFNDLKIDKNDFILKKNSIAAEWDKTNKEACDHGTIIHKGREDAIKAGDREELDYHGLNGDYSVINDYNIDLTGNHIYSEILLSYEYEGIWIAGHADLIINTGKDVIVDDFKTNKAIKTRGGYDAINKKVTKMKYPLNSLDDCNYYHYQMQLSVYAYMIEKLYGANIVGLNLRHYPHDGGDKWYKLEYRKDLVEKMLHEYKRKMDYMAFNDADLNITY